MDSKKHERSRNITSMNKKMKIPAKMRYCMVRTLLDQNQNLIIQFETVELQNKLIQEKN